MIKILISELRRIAANRPSGYYDEIIRSGDIETVEILVLDETVYRTFQMKYAPPTSPSPKPIHPIPRKDWPLWAKGLAMMSKPEDKGIGDVVARTVGAENSEAFKKWFKATTGKDCGCTGRQRRWNMEYPLP